MKARCYHRETFLACFVGVVWLSLLAFRYLWHAGIDRPGREQLGVLMFLAVGSFGSYCCVVWSAFLCRKYLVTSNYVAALTLTMVAVSTLDLFIPVVWIYDCMCRLAFGCAWHLAAALMIVMASVVTRANEETPRPWGKLDRH